MRTQKSVDSIANILQKFNPLEDKYISREFQSFGIYLAEKLGDTNRKSLYIKYAKTLPRPALEQALRFVIDANARNKPALFFWKLTEIGILKKKKKRVDKTTEGTFYPPQTT